MTTDRTATLNDEQRTALILLLGFLSGTAQLGERACPITPERFTEIYEALGIVDPMQYWPFLPPGSSETEHAARRAAQRVTVTKRMIDAAKAFMKKPVAAHLHSASGDPWVRALLESALRAES